MYNIHEQLDTLNTVLGRIADALEAGAMATPVHVESLDVEPVVAEEVSKKKVAKKKVAKKAEHVEPEIEQEAEPEQTEQTEQPTATVGKDEIRVALQSLDRARASEILKDHGATVLRNLAESKYQSVLDAAREAA
jgi:preprotein translocase subunit SecD